jgi:hypothetical protein
MIYLIPTVIGIRQDFVIEITCDLAASSPMKENDSSRELDDRRGKECRRHGRQCDI